MNQADSNKTIEQYRTLPMNSELKCNASLLEMTKMIKLAGDEIEEVNPDLEVPRAKTMLLLVIEKPGNQGCALWLATLTVLVRDVP